MSRIVQYGGGPVKPLRQIVSIGGGGNTDLALDARLWTREHARCGFSVSPP